MDILKLYKNEIKQIVDSCHRCADLGYVTSDGGNISLRVESNLILITPTQTPKRAICAEDICAVNLDGTVVFAANGKKPTGETPFHVRIMQKRSDVKAVLHTHPPILTGFAIANNELLCNPFLPEPIIEVGPLIVVPYETPLSEELSKQFDSVIDKSNGFLMENHGVVFCSQKDVINAVDMLQMSENMAQSVLVALQLGNCKPLRSDQINGMDKVISNRNLRMPGAVGKFKTVKELYGL